jgi:hypothetical protein
MSEPFAPAVLIDPDDCRRDGCARVYDRVVTEEAIMRVVFLSLCCLLLTACSAEPVPSVNVPAGIPQDDPLFGLRCWVSPDDASVTREQLEYILARSEGGDSMCKMLLGGLYENGRSVPQDIAKAKTLYQSAADVDERAYFLLGKLAESGLDGPPDYLKARQFYLRAATGGNSNNAEASLAKLMEEGKGGQQDLEGAMTLYLKATRASFGDEWDGIQRLRGRGVKLTAEQEQRYNKTWIGTTKGRIQSKILRVQDSVSGALKPGPVGKEVTVKLEYVLGSLVPRLSIVNSSNDNAVDQAVLQGFEDFRFTDGPILPQGQKTWSVQALIYVSSR